MPSPFPGMDPYLEGTKIWPDFHDHLASEIGAELNQALPSPFYARLEMRPEIGISEERGRIVPDVSIAEVWPPVHAQGTTVIDRPRTEISKSIEVRVLFEPLRHHFVEVRDGDHRLVTLIEIVSPSNKRQGVDREHYESKQQEILGSEANLIEIDLLRAGKRLYGNLMLEQTVLALEPAPDYLMLVNRFVRRHLPEAAYEMFPVSLRDVLPCIPVPLRGEYADVPLDLQYVVNRAYDRGPYRRGAVDYSQDPPAPILCEADLIWLGTVLKKARSDSRAGTQR